MTAPIDCTYAQELLFELRHGQIEAQTQTLFEHHLNECSTCRDLGEKLDSMLDEAMLWEPAGAGFDRDALFESILDRLDDGGEQTKTTAVSEIIVADQAQAPLPIFRAALTSAALILATLALFHLAKSSDLEPDPPPIITAATETTAPKVQSDDTALASDDEALYFEEVFAISEALRVLPAPQARWSVVATDEGWEMMITKGQILVEFLPRHDQETLSFKLPGAQGQVVGTVFFLDAQTQEVGVVTGEVLVSGDDQNERSVNARQLWHQGQVYPIDDERWSAAVAVVDPDEHQRRLALLREIRPNTSAEEPVAKPQPRPKPATPQKSTAPVPKPGPVRLRMDAEKALRDREFAAAARYYEELLQILPPKDRAAGSIRLDLARIYHRHLHDSTKTLTHLRYFIETWPDDAITPQAIAELCRLEDDPSTEPLCRRS